MEATKQTKMTKEDLHLSWKDKLNIIRDNRYFLMLFPIVMLAVMILIFGVATAGRFFKLSVMKGIHPDAHPHARHVQRGRDAHRHLSLIHI